MTKDKIISIVRDNKLFIGIEFLLLCVVLPGFILVNKLALIMLVFLWVASAYALFIVRTVYPEMIPNMWKWDAVTWPRMKVILGRWVLACIGMTVFLYFYNPDLLFRLLIERPYVVAVLFFVYPLISALPQEFIFCTYFFKRYAVFFTSERARIIASTIVFAYAHILFINWVAPILSLVAGYIFASTYSKTRSLAMVSIEHGLYGNYLFLVGLGWYFHGAH